MADNKVQIVITAKDTASAAFNTLNEKIKKASSSLASFAGGAASLYGLQRIAKSAVDAALGMEKLQASMSATMGQNAAREIQFVREESNRLGLAFQETGLAYAKFAASARNTSLEGEQTRQIFAGVSEAVASMRLSADESNGVFLALSQMISKGKVQAEELRGQLGERLPGAFRLSAEALGVTTAELDKMLEKGQVTAEDLLPKLAKNLHETYGKTAVEAAKGGQAEINRFNNAVFESSAALGQALMPSLTNLMNFIRDMIPYIKSFVFGIQSIGISAGSTVDKIGLTTKTFASPATMMYHKLFNTETWQQYQKGISGIENTAQEYANALFNRMNPSVSSALPKGAGYKGGGGGAGKAGKGGAKGNSLADSWARALADMQAEMDKLNASDLEQKLISLANKAGDATRQFAKIPGALSEIQKWLSTMSAAAIEQERLETEKKASEEILKIAQTQAEARKNYETYVTETTMSEIDKRVKAEQQAAEEMVQAQYNALVTENGLLENREEFLRRKEEIEKASAERIRQIRAEYEEKGKAKTGTYTEGLKQGFQDWLDELTNTYQQGIDFARTTADTMKQAFEDFFFDPMGFSFEDFGNTMRRILARATTDIIYDLLKSSNAFASLLGWFGLGGTGNMSGILTNPSAGAFGFAKGSVLYSPALSALENSIVNRPYIFQMAKGYGVIGEGSKAEGVLPLARTASGDLGVQTTGGGGNVIVHMNVNAMDAKSFNGLLYENKGALTSMIRAAMKDNHPGRRG